jgi:hypothetical protein
MPGKAAELLSNVVTSGEAICENDSVRIAPASLAYAMTTGGCSVFGN